MPTEKPFIALKQETLLGFYPSHLHALISATVPIFLEIKTLSAKIDLPSKNNVSTVMHPIIQTRRRLSQIYLLFLNRILLSAFAIFRPKRQQMPDAGIDITNSAKGPEGQGDPLRRARKPLKF